MFESLPPANYKTEQDSLHYHAFKNASVGLLIVGENRNIVSANDYMCKYFGIIQDRADELSFTDLFQCYESSENCIQCGFIKKCRNCYIRNGLYKILTHHVSVESISVSRTFTQNTITLTKWFLVSGNPMFRDGKWYAVLCFEDFTPFKQQELLLLERLELDLATDTLNKHSLLKFIQGLASSERKQSFVICMMDFDDFKEINDQYGHNVGDNVLKAFSRISHKNIRAHDILGRYGGEEFVFVFLEASVAQAAKVICKIQKELRDIFSGTVLLPVTFSAGLAHIDLQTSSQACTLLIDEADKLLYQAKKRGKNRIVSVDFEHEFES